MDKLTAILTAHTSYYSGDECSCGVDSYSTEGWDFNAHLAEMLKPLLAEVWESGGTAAIEREHTYGKEEKAKYSNPYEKETN